MSAVLAQSRDCPSKELKKELGVQLARVDDLSLRDDIMSLELDSFTSDGAPLSPRLKTQFRRNLLKQSNEGFSRQPPVRRYVNDLETIQAGIDDGVDVTNPAGVIEEFARRSDNLRNFENQAFEARRVAKVVEKARTDDNIRGVDLDYSSGSAGRDVDYRIRRFSGDRYVEAKAPESALSKQNLRDYISGEGNSAQNKFDDLSGEIEQRDTRVLEVERRVDDDLTLDDIESEIRRQRANIREDGGSFKIDEIRIVEDSREIVFEIDGGTISRTVVDTTNS